MNPRTRRLQSDFDLVRTVFSGHPHVRVNPLGFERPPESYVVEYRIRGLRLDGEQPVVVEEHEVEFMLPRRYPAEKPYIVPKTQVFHPNIKEYVCIADYWAAETTLADIIAKVGDMIQWRIYNLESPLDPKFAAKWARDNESLDLFPIGNVELGVGEVEIQVLEDAGVRESEDISSLATNARPDATGVDEDDQFTVELK